MTRRLHLPIFLLALAIAVVIKIAVNEAEQISEAAIDAKVFYNPPETLVILNPTEQVKVRLRGKRSEVIQVQANPFLVRVSVEVRQSGTLTVDLEPSAVDAPGNLDVVTIEPNRLTLEVEPLRTATLPIEVLFRGEPAAGALVGTPIIRPPAVEVTGPRSRVERMESLTAPISLEGHALTFEETVSVISPDPLVNVIRPNKVVVRVPMREPELSGTAGRAARAQSLAGEAPSR